MLEGIDQNEIVVGAYTHGGGICPMLAAHRAGGRTSFIAFARAWDRFAFRGRGKRACKARRATERELLTLRTHLEATLLEDDGPSVVLGQAISEHRALAAPARHRKPRPGDADRSRELRGRPGWSWTRLFRRYDEYQQALDELDAQRAELREHSLV